MSVSKFIHDYLEGFLNESEKEALFSLLAQDSEARAEFDEQVALHTIVQSDMHNIQPPAEVSGALFSSLGFENAAQSFQPEKKASAFSNLFRRYWPAVFLLFISVPSTIIVTNYINSDDNFANNIQERKIPIVKSGAAVENIENTFSRLDDEMIAMYTNEDFFDSDKNQRFASGQNSNRNSNNAASSYNNDTDSRINGSSQNELNSNFADNSRDEYKNNFYEIENSDSPKLDHYSNNELLAQNNLDTRSEMNSNSMRTLNNSNYIPGVNTMLSFSPREINNYKWTIELAKLSASSNVNENKFSDLNTINNLSVSILYKLNDNSSLGIQFGRNHFPMEFEHIIAGKFVTQFQRPELNYYAAMYRYSIQSIFSIENLNLFAQGNLGFASVGPYTKAGVGLNYSISNITMSFGYDASSLIYNVDDNYYTTYLYGLNYSIGFKF